VTSEYSAVEAALLTDVRSRGHWEVVIRPQPFKQRVTDSKELLQIIEKSAVELGGWRFPFVPDREGELTNGQRLRDEDSIRQVHRWEHHLEAWRFYRTGQFGVATSVGWDWRDQSGWWPVRDGETWNANSVIGIGHIVQMLLQIFLFASRIAESTAGDEKLDIEIVLAPTLGRELFSDFPLRMLRPGYKADIDRIRLPMDVSRTELLASTDDLTASAATRVFGEFGFKPAPNILKEFVAEVRK
jgi:hypothetical protein